MKKYVKSVIMAIFVVFTFTLTSFAGDVKKAPEIQPNFPMIAGEDVMLMWSPVPGAVKYKIYRDGKYVGEAPAPPFSEKAPTSSGEYIYTITGIDKDGAEGPSSLEGKLSIKALLAPKGIKHNLIEQAVRLNWEAVSDADIYDIYRSDSKEGKYEVIGNSNENSYLDTGVEHTKEFYGKTFYYKVVAKDKFNKRSPDSEIYEVKVYKFTLPPFFKPADKLIIRGTKESHFYKPEVSSVSDAVFLSGRENLACVDTVSGNIAVVDNDGKVVRRIGEKGDDPDQLGEPIRIAADSKDNIYVLDAKKSKIFSFGPDDKLIYAADYHTISEKDILNRHEGLTSPVTPKLNALTVVGNTIYAADKITGVIQIYNKDDGSFVDYFKSVKEGNILYFGVVNKLVLLEGYKLYIARPLEKKVSVMHIETGGMIYEFGSPESPFNTFKMINSMTIDPEGIVVLDGVNNTIQCFSNSFGKYLYSIGNENFELDNKDAPTKPVLERSYTGPIGIDKKGRFWIYSDKDKGFSVREDI